MKLEKQGFANIYGTAAGGQRFTATIRQGIGSTADLRGIHDEIVRRVNSFDALVEALERLALIIKGSNVEGLWLNHPELPEQGPLDLINAALALAAASKTRTEGTPDAKKGTQGKDSQ